MRILAALIIVPLAVFCLWVIGNMMIEVIDEWLFDDQSKDIGIRHGYQPETGLDQENPPQGGSGVPRGIDA